MRRSRVAAKPNFISDERGVAAIEFAFLALPFFFIVFCLLETCIIFIAEVAMDNAVQKVARQVRVGNVEGVSAAGLSNALCDHLGHMFACDRLLIDLRSYPVFAEVPQFPPISDGILNASDFVLDVGEAENIMALRVYYAWPIVTGFLHSFLSDLADGSHLIAGHVVFKNEPY
jgi:Flp pilus assembly protein TadG